MNDKLELQKLPRRINSVSKPIETYPNDDLQECPLSDPQGLMKDISFEPKESIKVTLPTLEPVCNYISMTAQKEDGLFAKLTCEPGEDRKKFYREMQEFFS